MTVDPTFQKEWEEYDLASLGILPTNEIDQLVASARENLEELKKNFAEFPIANGDKLSSSAIARLGMVYARGGMVDESQTTLLVSYPLMLAIVVWDAYQKENAK